MTKNALSRGLAYILAISIAVLSLQFFFTVMTISAASIGVGDFYIFLDHANLYLRDGALYSRNLLLYGPGEPIYKFPPVYASFLVAALQSGTQEPSLYLYAWLLQLASFLGGILLCLHAVKVQPAISRPLTIACIFALSLDNNFLIENSARLQLEPYIFLLLSAAFFMVMRGKIAACGFFIGLAATIKIYPAFLAFLILILNRKNHFLVGMLIGIIISLLISLQYVSLAEHIFYLTEILPKLLSEAVYRSDENISVANMITSVNPTINPQHINRGVLAAALILWLIPAARQFIKNEINPDQETTAINFSALVMVMMISMPNFWWNYQILNFLPAISAIIIISNKPSAHLLPAIALLLSFSLQFLITAFPLLSTTFYNELILNGNSAQYITLRGMIQVFLFIAVLSLQWQIHRKIHCHKKINSNLL